MGRGCLKGSNDLRTGAEGPTDKRSIGSVADKETKRRQKGDKKETTKKRIKGKYKKNL
jgi:hypothetical protein